MRATVALLVLAACGSQGGASTPTLPEPGPSVDAAPAPFAVDVSRPITDIRVTGLGPRTKAARAVIGSKIGDVIDPLQIRRDQVALWALGGIATLDVTAVGAEDGVELVFAAHERPRLSDITVWGAEHANLVSAIHAFGIDFEDVFDPGEIQRGRARMLAAYHDNGFPFADATWSVSPGKGGTLELRVDVTEGKAVEIRTITFRGNKRFTAKELLAVISDNTNVDPGDPYAPAMFDVALLYLNSAYFDAGHVAIQIGATEVTYDADGTHVDLVIPIVEGAQYKLGKIVFQGALVDTEARELAILGVKTGDVFNRTRLQAGIRALTALHQRSGQPQASLTPLTKLDEKKHTVALTIDIGTF